MMSESSAITTVTIIDRADAPDRGLRSPHPRRRPPNEGPGGVHPRLLNRSHRLVLVPTSHEASFLEPHFCVGVSRFSSTGPSARPTRYLHPPSKTPLL